MRVYLAGAMSLDSESLNGLSSLARLRALTSAAALRKSIEGPSISAVRSLGAVWLRTSLSGNKLVGKGMPAALKKTMRKNFTMMIRFCHRTRRHRQGEVEVSRAIPRGQNRQRRSQEDFSE